MRPVSGGEQSTISQIVTFFKDNAMPVEMAGAIYRIYSLPHVFEIKFYNEGGSLPVIGKCALTNVSVKYGGDRWSTFSDGRPVQTDLTLSFTEIELQTMNLKGKSLSGGMEIGAVDSFSGMAKAAVGTAARNAIST